MSLKQVSAAELNPHLGTILQQAQIEPVSMIDQGKSNIMMLSHPQYQTPGEYSLLLNQLEKNHRQAKANGLTEETLHRLLYEQE